VQTKQFLSNPEGFKTLLHNDLNTLEFLGKKKLLTNYEDYSYIPVKYLFWEAVSKYSDSF
jgi:hypothetical protein